MRAGSGAECREVGWGLPERATLAGRSARGSGTGPGLQGGLLQLRPCQVQEGRQGALPGLGVRWQVGRGD